ncbi:unnamed protein product [Kuraishia capsulata CBS 1993]|uniref:Metal homeostatis protein bsd2 n=1 Tax=Kuraishia capsulata CBS 1993 TaxID=1382522 RepID=W6MST6_9ASCO|nr:uncharacterized protein KUCA_T00005880001 [Kuraishia capsulata CBS 1993]CDK29886.1 unnamed protein product [Kuraishia capsulata CBS 1993]
MSRYQKIRNSSDESDVHFDRDIELSVINDSSHSSERENFLLSSFNEDEDITNKLNNSDAENHFFHESDDENSPEDTRLTNNEDDANLSFQEALFAGEIDEGSSRANNTVNSPATISTNTRPNLFQRLGESVRSSPTFSRFFARDAVRYHGQVMGQGSENDGVFNNLVAKPEVQAQDEENLPTYEEAALDATPPYWESSVMASGYEDEIFVDGLPVGNLINFIWNMMVSVAFQFIGFVVTYLLHTSHAAKEGSRAGLGITLMTYGYNIIPYGYGSGDISDEERFEPSAPNDYDINSSNILTGSIDEFTSSLNGVATASSSEATSTGASSLSASSLSDTPILAYGLIALGLFMVIKAIIDYHRARRMERIILHPPSNYTPPMPETV